MGKVSKILQSFNAGELSPLMDARNDQTKYQAGCRTMENFIPLVYGGCTQRPGTEYITACKASDAASRLVGFEHSVNDTYMLEFANQVIRVFKDGTAILEGTGVEDATTVDAAGTTVSHWLLNDDTNTTAALDRKGTHNGTITGSTASETIHETGKVGTGCFDLATTYAVEMADAGTLSFTDNTDDEDFSIVSWIFVTDTGSVQTIFSKWKEDTLREYRFVLDENRKLKFELSDDSVNLSTSLIAQWKLNDVDADTVVDDSSGNGHTGTATANCNTITATGKIGTCFNFSGDEGVSVNDNAAFSFDDTADKKFSIAAWIYVDSTNDTQYILTKTEVTESREWAFFLSSKKIFMRLWDDSAGVNVQRVASTAMTEGWHFVGMTYDSSHASWTDATAANFITIYVDGVEAASSATNNAAYKGMEAGVAKVGIGERHLDAGGIDTAFSFNDKIDNVLIWSIVLTAGDFLALYNNGTGTESLAVTFPRKVSDDALSLGWHFVGVTYNPGTTTGATAASLMTLYVDGAAVDATGTENANYVAMEDTNIKARIGAQIDAAASLQNIFADKIDNVILYSTVLSAANVLSLYTTTSIYEITTPYLTADLFALKFEHSADVTFITHPDYEPRRLSRLGDTVWTLAVEGLKTGPFRDQNTDIAKTITASATTGTVTLTATGHSPFVLGSTAGHEPSGALATSKSVTGALFKLVHAAATDSIDDVLTDNYTDDDTLHTSITSELAVPKGVTWDFTTNGTWTGTVKLEREYNNSGVWETVHTVVGVDNKNATTSGTENVADAQYRIKMHESGDAAENCEVQFSIRDTSHIGIVEITSVTSSSVAIGVVLATLADTTATHRWSEGSFSNYRGWPIDAVISPEERLTFAGNKSEPLTTWGSVIGDFTDFKLGTNDDDALNLTLVGSGQQNRIRWLLSKDTLVLGTVGGEHLLGASKDSEALTPSNIQAKLQTTYGSENIAAKIINQAILFVQRGGKKIREFLYNFEADAHKADDLTVFAEHITGDGITDMAFQRTPDPILWCVRSDGEMAIMSYERDQNVFSWSRLVTHTNLAGTYADSDFESVAVIYGGANSEDEVWVSVRRTIGGVDARYIERFTARDLPSSASDYKFLDSYITDTSGDVTIDGLDHLEGQTVQVLGDGLVQATKIVGATTTGTITAATAASKYQVGVGYTATVKPMKLDLQGMGLAVTKKINRGVFNFFETIGGKVGTSTSKMHGTGTGTTLFTGSKEIPLSGGYSREGDIMARQTDPLPMTLLSFSLDVGSNAD